MKELKTNTYLFDFDGVLVDSMPTWAGTYRALLDAKQIPYPIDFVKIITPLGNEGAARYCVSLGLDMETDAILAHAFGVYEREYTENIGPKANVVRVLHELKARGDRLNVLTGSSHRYVDPCLQNAGIYDLFDRVWSVDDFGIPKSDVRIYERAAQALGLSVADCIFADDNYIAVLTAKKAGMRTIGVYDASSENFESEIRAAADAYIRDFSEISLLHV